MAETDANTQTTTTEEQTTQTAQNEGQQSQQAQQEKTFTQSEVNQISSREKKQGRAAVMRELGLDPDDKNAIKLAKQVLDSQKTDEQKHTDDLNNANKAMREAESRAEAAENKLTLLSNGCRSDCVDDILVLVKARVNEDTDFNAALSEVKKKYPASFGVSGDTGTGHGTGHKKTTETQIGSLGKRLAQSQTKPINNPYFKN